MDVGARENASMNPPIPDSDGLLRQGLGSDDRPYLGTLNVVDGLVRGFLTSINDARREQIEGGQADPVAVMQAEAQRLQGIFYGRDPAYRAGPWHRPGMLGRQLVVQSEMGGDEDDAVERLLIHTGRQFAEALGAFERDEIDDETFKFRLEVAIEPAVYALAGIPYPDEEE